MPQPHSVVLVRHCKAAGQEPEAPLTLEGKVQAEALCDFLSAELPGRIVSSPFLRALQSIQPLADRLGLRIECDPRLVERQLGVTADGNWRGALERSFQNSEICLTDGESSATAVARGRSVVDDILTEMRASAIVVTHGNLLALIARSFRPDLGFEFWASLSNPDVFRLTRIDGVFELERIWK
jgi:2,3-bisphosphoglycerate-dependent phosphoglycerate mutase